MIRLSEKTTTATVPGRAAGIFRRLTSRELLILLLLILAGLAGNVFSASLYFGVDLIFGSAAALMALRLLGGVWGVGAACAVSLYTLRLWGHPYAIMIFTLEAVVVAAYLRRAKDDDLIFADAVFWVIIGMPLVWICYAYGLRMDPASVMLIMLKQSINGLLNAMIAQVLLHYTPLAMWLLRRKIIRKLSFQHTLFTMLALAVVVPALTISTVDNRKKFVYMSEILVERLHDEIKDLNAHMSHWLIDFSDHLEQLGWHVLHSHAGGLWTESEMRRFAQSVGQVTTLQVTNAEGIIVASVPQVDDQQAPYAGRLSSYHELFQHIRDSRKPALSDVHVSEAANEPHISLTVPVWDAKDRNAIAGYVVIALRPEGLRAPLSVFDHEHDLFLTLLDRSQQVVIGDDPELLPLQRVVPLSEQPLVPIIPELYHRLPETPNLPEMNRWRQSDFLSVMPLGNDLGWSLIARLPLQNHVDRLRSDLVGNLVLLTSILGLALIVSRVLSRKTVQPVVRLTSLTNEIAAAPRARPLGLWPASSIAEVDALSRNFRRMTRTVAETMSETQRTADELRQLIETANAPIFGIDTAGCLTDWNRMAEQLTGYAPEVVLGQQFVQHYVVKDFQDGINAILADALNGQETASYAVPVITKTGGQLMVLVNATTRRDTDGRITGVVGVGQDITEQTRVLEALRQEKAFSDRVINALPGLFYLINEQGRLVRWNPRLEQVSGYTAGEIAAMHMSDFFHGTVSMPRVSHAFEHTLKTGHAQIEAVFASKDGESRPFLFSGTRMDIHGQPHIIGMGLDISEQKRIEAELAVERANLEQTVADRTEELRQTLCDIEETNLRLEEANRAKSRFLSSMSHELRTPLNGILGFADLLKQQFFGALNEKQQDYVRQIDESGKHLLDLINELLDMAKIDAGATELDIADISPGECCAAITGMMESQFSRKHLTLTSCLDPILDTIQADSLKLKQIMLNLLSNAIKYTPEGGSIDIRASREASGIRIEVQDSGIGIEADQQERIFSEFYQADRKRDETLGGTGIGLALTRRLVELHGGEIGVHSTVGEGSTFWFTLPTRHHALAVEPEAEEQPDMLESGTAQHGSRVLIAEDNEVNLAILRDMLYIQRYDTLVARNGQEAVELARNEQPDIILMDMRMPVMDGLEAARRIRELPECAEIPIIALTASVSPDDRAEQQAAGCTAYLAKPIQTSQLFDILEHYLP